MKDPVLAIITRLKADTAIAAIVSTRVYRATLPKNPTFPAIVVAKIDNSRPNDTTTGRYARSRIQCTTFAASDGAADNLSELIADNLNGLTNTYLSSPGIYVVSIFDEGTVPDNNPEIGLWTYHRDFQVDYAY